MSSFPRLPSITAGDKMSSTYYPRQRLAVPCIADGVRPMTNARPFRFGVADGDGVPSREAWATLVRRAEALGYATFLIADHYVNAFPPISSLMAAADVSSAIRIGSFVFDNDFRHPAQLAKEVATLDLLSGGRFELGMGAGWHQPDY